MTVARCPLCTGLAQIWFSLHQRDLVRCGACRFAWVVQGVMLADGVSIYEHEEPIFLRDGNADYYLDEGNLANAEAKVAWVRTFRESGTLLDVGANFGHFAAAAGSQFDVLGLEPSALAVRWAGDRFGVRVEAGSIYDDRPDLEGRFDVVTMWDVIEHLSTPGAALSQIRKYLRPGGLLFLTTPDSGSVVARLMGRQWHYLDVVQHVALFDRMNLAVLLARHGFRVRAMRTFGRLYRTSYVVERTRYLAHGSVLWRAVHAALRPAASVAPAQVTINLGDVMGVVAEVST